MAALRGGESIVCTMLRHVFFVSFLVRVVKGGTNLLRPSSKICFSSCSACVLVVGYTLVGCRLGLKFLR